ncbi:linamarin synthase 2 [Selaginella moellendorffii]|nr:linamarin synthase 2 [Selaginella moellendorffii]|eukprot:XP_002971630.2 linamarin synthase 2 [Selaginella moellendorffii]
MAEGERPQHAVVVAYPGQGHINPLMQLSLRLASSMGFFVTFVTTRGNHESILAAWERQGVAPPWERGLSIQMRPIPDDVLPPRSMGGIFHFLEGVKKLGPGLEELMEALAKDPSMPPVSCVVSDAFLLWAAGVARRFGVPWVMYFPLPVLAFLIQHHASATEILSSRDPECEDLIECPGVIPLHPLELPSLVHNPQDTTHELLRGVSDGARNSAAWVFFNTCPALEQPLINAAREQGFDRFVPVAPLLPPSFLGLGDLDHRSSPQEFFTSSLWEQDLSCLDWLDRQPPRSVLYISFGSIAAMNFSQLEVLLGGLLDLGERFLWVLRPDLVSDMGEEDHARFLDRAKDLGLVVRWAPQLQVLRHGSTAAFLTHCGWNSTFESICAGVPTICQPCFAEQKANAKYVVEVWKTGVKLAKGHRGDFSKEDVLRAISAVMGGGEQTDSIRKRAADLRDACRKDFQEMSGLKAFAADLLAKNKSAEFSTAKIEPKISDGFV